MATREQQQEDPQEIQTPQLSFAGGINTTAARDKMAEDEAFDITNLRFNEESSLIPRPTTIVSVDRISAATITTRITSIFVARFLSGQVKSLFTTGTQLYEFFDTTSLAPINETNALTFPNDTFWMWKMYNNHAIGVNRGGAGTTNPVKETTAAGAAALGGSPPKAKYIEIWNDRVWLTGLGNDSNTLYGSALGTSEDWTTTGVAGRVIIAIEPGDGDVITGIIAFRERLFIFKRNRIYTVQAVGGAFPTDASALSVELYSQNVGCISAYSIQPVLDDVLFLAPGGVASLVASERVGDFTAAFLSRKIKAIQDIPTITPGTEIEISAMTVPEHNQYWLLVDSTNSFILDYRKIQEGVVRWTRYTGNMAGAVMARNPYGSVFQRTAYNIGGKPNSGASTFRVWYFLPATNVDTPDDNKSGTDAETAILHSILTRMYNLGYPFNRKNFKRMAFDFIGFSPASSTTVSVSYNFDNITASPGVWSIVIPVGAERSFKQNRKFKYLAKGARGTDVSFNISTNSLDQYFGIKGISLWFSVLPAKRVNYA